MNRNEILRAAARNWENANEFVKAAERYAQANRWNDAGRCLAKAGHPVEAANAYARADNPIEEARQWLVTSWPERARRSYQRALERELVTHDEVEALLGVGEVDLASEEAFIVASSASSSSALRSLARLAAARGRPDLAARAWDLAIGRNKALGGNIFGDWAVASPWNRSLVWERSLSKASSWPSRSFEDVRLELIWEKVFSSMMHGNRALAWSSNGKNFAAVTFKKYLILGELTGARVHHQVVSLESYAVAFIPESDSALVGCRKGEIIRVNTSGSIAGIETLRMPMYALSITFSPGGSRLAIANGTSDGLLRVFWWYPESTNVMQIEEQTNEEGPTNPSSAWSPDGRTLAWCPGPWAEDTVRNDVYLFSPEGTRCVHGAHTNGINGVCFSPDGHLLATASFDHTIAIRDARTGEVAGATWRCDQSLGTVHFHPYAQLVACGGSATVRDWSSSSYLYLFRLVQHDVPRLHVLQQKATETAVKSVAFSPDGDHLLMSTREKLHLYRIHLL